MKNRCILTNFSTEYFLLIFLVKSKWKTAESEEPLHFDELLTKYSCQFFSSNQSGKQLKSEEPLHFEEFFIKMFLTILFSGKRITFHRKIIEGFSQA